MNPCSTGGCPGEVTLFDGGPPLCRACREASVADARESDRRACCVHLGAPRDQWLELYGTPAGMETWLASQAPLYARVLSGPNEGRERTPKQARAAAMARWRSLRNDSLRYLPRARSCDVGLGGRAVAQVLHTDVHAPAGGGVSVRHRLSAAVCDRQACCRSYAAAMAPDNDIAGDFARLLRRIDEDEASGGEGDCTAGGAVARYRHLRLAAAEDEPTLPERPGENAGDTPPVSGQ